MVVRCMAGRIQVERFRSVIGGFLSMTFGFALFVSCGYGRSR